MRGFRRTLISACAFLALTTVAGGVGLLTDAVSPGEPPLHGSPFTSFVVPGLVLLVVVGGAARTATLLLLARHRDAGRAVVVAGLTIVCYEAVEVATLGSPAGVAGALQAFYALFGLVLVAAAGTSRAALP